MPRVSAPDGVTVYYESHGDGETVAMVGDVGFGAWQWGWQHAAVVGPFESLVTDLRGTGRSDAPSGPYSTATLAADLRAVLADVGSRRVHLVGAGLGGTVALAVAGDGRVRSLTLIASTLSGDAVDESALGRMAGSGRESLEPCFSEAFFDERAEVVERIGEWRADEDAAPESRRAQAAALLDYEFESPYEVTVPALVLHGRDDPVVPVEAGRDLAAALPRGEFTALDGRHLAHVESSRAANDALVGFLEAT